MTLTLPNDLIRVILGSQATLLVYLLRKVLNRTWKLDRQVDKQTCWFKSPPWWWCSFKEINTCTFNWCFTFTIAEVNIKFFGYFAGAPWSVPQSSHSVWGTFLLHVYLYQHYLCRNYGEGGDSWENNEWEKYKCRWVDSVAMS